MVLSDIYLRIEIGTVTALFGRNGCGKSSLFKILFGGLSNETASIRINGKVAKPAYKFGVTYLPQVNFIPESFSLKKAFKYFDVPIIPFIKVLPEFEGKEYLNMNEYSGGQRRLVELYLILKKDSKFVILDEPFTHIMPLYLTLVKQWINDEKQHKGILISDHLYEPVLELSDFIYTLRNGRIISCKNREELITLEYLNE